ncbi:MAG: YHYH protein [Candidatus Kapaibacterium sp.]
MKKSIYIILLSSLAIAALGLVACSDDNGAEAPTYNVIVDVDKNLFLSGGLAEPITIVSRTLSDGSTADCYKIVVNNTPSDHTMGPWCPTNISDDATAGGIWLEGGEVYDVDGEFIKNLSTFYKDNTWMMYDISTGEITKTMSKADCEAAANPNVGAEYENYCVECLPSYLGDMNETYYIPVTPKAASSIKEFGGPGPMSSGPSVRGIAFNGVRFDAPAPVNAILGAYTLAPFDDAGGHINLQAGYHYHAATGVSTKITQSDGHAPMIGYALDGYGLFANTDAEGKEYTDLDQARGHYDEVRGYHYHVDKAGNNNFINGLRGVYAQ